VIIFSILIVTPSKVFHHAPTTPAYHSLPKHVRAQVDCIADNIYFEARGELIQGQIAVGLVTLNRVQHGKYPSTPCRVVRQTTDEVCQFSWWCDASLRHAQSHRRTVEYKIISNLAVDMYFNRPRYKDITRWAVFYHATHVNQHRLGVDNLVKTAHIGNHIFYRTKQ
jgi:spore germination cell wall hydrolase CwlJ-like protein